MFCYIIFVKKRQYVNHKKQKWGLFFQALNYEYLIYQVNILNLTRNNIFT